MSPNIHVISPDTQETANQIDSDDGNLKLNSKGVNIGYLNIQGICARNLTKFDEVKLMLTSPNNTNLHIFGISETKLKKSQNDQCIPY